MSMYNDKKCSHSLLSIIPSLSQSQAVGVSLFIYFLLQLLISLCSYSGQNNSPKFGDYEAQRHWMELTYHLPLSTWYKEAPNNNLSYWGLDYPPLTAYHSWFFGFISNSINKDWISLNKSHGIQDEYHKFFMRFTVIISNILLYGTSIIFFHDVKIHKNLQTYLQILLYPGLLLIDCGHFQYNHIALALTIWAFYFLQRKKYEVGCLLFVMSLSFKQISLYYSLSFFVYLLSKCRHYEDNGNFNFTKSFKNVFYIGVITILSFVVIWLPFCLDIDNLKHVISRIFPVSRGIFEDKVASFWCVSNVIFKQLKTLPSEKMLPLCTLSVIVGCLPSLIILFKKTTKLNMIKSLFCCSSAFFLFSFHVHEKSILFPSAIMVLYINYDSFTSIWYLIISSLSLYPLLLVDNIPESIFVIFAYYILFMFNNNKEHSFLYKLCAHSSIIVGFLITLSTFILPVIPRYPYIYQLLVATYSFIHFFGFFVSFHFVNDIKYKSN